MNHVDHAFQALQPLFPRTTFGSTVLSVERVWFYKLILVSGLVKDLIVKTPLTFLLICGDDIFSYLASDHSLTF